VATPPAPRSCHASPRCGCTPPPLLRRHHHDTATSRSCGAAPARGRHNARPGVERRLCWSAISLFRLKGPFPAGTRPTWRRAAVTRAIPAQRQRPAPVPVDPATAPPLPAGKEFEAEAKGSRNASKRRGRPQGRPRGGTQRAEAVTASRLRPVVLKPSRRRGQPYDGADNGQGPGRSPSPRRSRGKVSPKRTRRGGG
jgi:hypothetical protein